MLLILERPPDGPDLIPAQHPISLPGLRGHRHAVAGVEVHDVAADAEVVDLADQRLDPVRHDRGAALDDAVEELHDVAALDVLRLETPPVG